ncbi:conserved protein of unknown function (plasmid) [Rhodovastum atsumiense]|uniref:Uncharacterized protein n=1 Tax=Rhodovastum atsumiense TaxID=504468 RepID=A0A5M6IN40_9PROT|nr:hypothetical protein [Rhodovastum atsumiense]KAA5609680.1 hypothetical protein F1189_23250 [Rhodovastum atsumiense]CAH2606446.1 conserved protein of unknown function [Rhodovastum atsumiense]
MRHKDIVQQAISFANDGIRIDRHKAIEFGFPMIEANRELLVEGAKRDFARSVKEAATKQMRRMATDTDAQSCFDMLRRRYALDDEAKVIKETDFLREMELDRIIAIREKSVADDMQHLSALKEVRASLKPIWRAHPDWTLGECERAFRNVRLAA